jgi:hypothetical protein
MQNSPFQVEPDNGSLLPTFRESTGPIFKGLYRIPRFTLNLTMVLQRKVNILLANHSRFPDLGFRWQMAGYSSARREENLILVRGNGNNAMFYVAELTPT